MDIERYAAQLEAEQAERDYQEAYRALAAGGFILGSPEDYATWSAASYADSADCAHAYIPAEKLQRKLSNAHYARMNDGIKGKRSTASASVTLAKNVKR